MKRFAAFVLACFCCQFLHAQSTVTVTGHIAGVSGSSSTSKTFIRFELKGDGGQQCRVAGSAIISPYVQDAAPDASGNISQAVIPNSSITCGTSTGNSKYLVTTFRNGIGQPGCYLQINSNTNLNSAACLNAASTPVVTTPTDSVYARVDGSNAGFTGNLTLNSHNVTGIATLSASSVNSQLNAALATGADIGAQINNSCAASAGQTVWVPASSAGSFSTTISLSNPCHILFDQGTWTYTGSGNAFTCNATTRGVIIEGGGTRADQGTAKGTQITVSNTAANGLVAANCPGIQLRGLNFIGPGSGTGNGVKIAGHGCLLNSVQAASFGGDGFILDGGTANTIKCLFINTAAMVNGGNGYNLQTSQANETGFYSTDGISNGTNYRIGSAVNNFQNAQSQGATAGTGFVFISGGGNNTGAIYSEPIAPETAAYSFASGANFNNLVLLNGTPGADSGTDNSLLEAQSNQTNKLIMKSAGFISFNKDSGFSRLAGNVLAVDGVPNDHVGILTMGALRINNGAVSGHVPRGNGSNYVDAALNNSDLAGYVAIDTPGLTGNVSVSTLSASVPAGMYRVTAYVVITTAASVSSTLPTVQVVYTDKDSNTSVTVDATPIAAGVALGQNGALTANTVGSLSTGVIGLNVKASTTIQYQTTGYASNAAGMTYALHIRLEAL